MVSDRSGRLIASRMTASAASALSAGSTTARRPVHFTELGHSRSRHTGPEALVGAGGCRYWRPYAAGVTVIGLQSTVAAPGSRTSASSRRRCRRRGGRRWRPTSRWRATRRSVRRGGIPAVRPRRGAMPECEPWVSSLAAQQGVGTASRPRPVMNSPMPAPTGDGTSVAATTPTAARAAPPRRVRSRPYRSVMWSPTTRPTSIPPATRRSRALRRRARHRIDRSSAGQPTRWGSLGEGDGEADEEQPADDRA